MRTTRTLWAIAIAVATATPLVSNFNNTLRAADAPVAPVAGGGAPAVAPVAGGGNGDAIPPLPGKAVANPLTTAVDDFWHYAKIAKYDLATQAGEKVLATGASAGEILLAFEGVSFERREDLYESMFKWVGVDPLKGVSEKLIAKLKEGQLERFKDPKWISTQVERLSVNERAFELALGNLRQSGEYAAAVMVDYLRDANKKQFHSDTRRALVRLGRQALNPLVATLDGKDNATLITMIGILGDIGYDVAAPYVARVYARKDAGIQEVQSAAAIALQKLGVPDAKTADPAELFYQLAQKFYYNSASIVPDPRFPDAAHVWYWDESKGLVNKDIPVGIFNERMAQRSCEYALKLDPKRGDVVSLWLAANNKREAELGEGKIDASHEGPDAHFYNVALGTQYGNAVLSRALKDRSAPVALKVIKSLQEIVGQSNMFLASEGNREPIVEAMSFPDRLVRFEAAMTLAQALPQKPFMGQEVVVPTLGEAISNTGKPNVVLVAADGNAANLLKESLKDAVKGETGTNAETATAAAGRLPSVDAMIVDSRNNKDTDAVLAGPRAAGVPKIVIVENKASNYVAQEMTSDLINTIVAGTAPVTPEVLTAAITKARARAGAAPLDDKAAEVYAQKAANLLERLAISRGQVLEVSTAAPALMRALDDSRVEIAKSSANVLGLIEQKEIQPALVAKAGDEKTGDDLKVSCFKALARNAKFFGNKLEAAQVEVVQKAVETSTNQGVKAAAAEAQGALNLSADRAKNLIINQSQIGK